LNQQRNYCAKRYSNAEADDERRLLILIFAGRQSLSRNAATALRPKGREKEKGFEKWSREEVLPVVRCLRAAAKGGQLSNPKEKSALNSGGGGKGKYPEAFRGSYSIVGLRGARCFVTKGSSGGIGAGSSSRH